MITPCISQCKLADGICAGCKRTREQITEWKTYTDAQRLSIMKDLGYGVRTKKLKRIHQK